MRVSQWYTTSAVRVIVGVAVGGVGVGVVGVGVVDVGVGVAGVGGVGVVFGIVKWTPKRCESPKLWLSRLQAPAEGRVSDVPTAVSKTVTVPTTPLRPY